MRSPLALLAGIVAALGVSPRLSISDGYSRSQRRVGSGGHKHPRQPRGFNGHKPAGSKLSRKAAEGKL